MARTEFPAKATHAQTRAHNAALVLRALYDLGPISRADIARLTGLTRTSVGELVSDLEQEGLAVDVGRGPSTGGKQPTLVALNAGARTVITLDLGERTFTAALANLRGEIAARVSRDLDGRDGEQAVDVVHELIDEVRAAATSPILGIGVGTPGIVDQAGTIRWAVSLDWQDLPLARILQDRHQLPTVVANDSRAAAFATYLFSGDERPTNLVVIKVGRGIGAGLVLRDQLFGGDGEAAGEIGHVVVDPDGVECHCGRFGCLETVASAPAVLRASGAKSLDELARTRPKATTKRSASYAPPAEPSAARSPISSARSTSGTSRWSAPSPASASHGSTRCATRRREGAWPPPAARRRSSMAGPARTSRSSAPARCSSPASSA